MPRIYVNIITYKYKDIIPINIKVFISNTLFNMIPEFILYQLNRSKTHYN